MTHEDKIIEELDKVLPDLWLDLEKDNVQEILKPTLYKEELWVESQLEISEGKLKDWLRQTLTTYRTQVLEEVEKEIEHAINVREYKLIKHYEPMSIETITIPANQEQAYNLARTVTLKDVLDIVKNKHPTN